MAVLLLLVIALAAATLIAAVTKRNKGSQTQDAEAETRRWLDRLGAGITTLDAGGNTAAGQALADAAERHNAASVQQAQARTPTQYALASQTAIEGLHYIRAARTALNLDPGPPVPPLRTQAEPLTAQRHVFVGHQEHMASPTPGDATPYYHPGGLVGGRPVPAGWYSTPWWKTALVAGAAGMGGALLMDTLLDGFHHHAPGGGLFNGPDGLF